MSECWHLAVLVWTATLRETAVSSLSVCLRTLLMNHLSWGFCCPLKLGIFLRELCVFGDVFCWISLCTDECQVSQSCSEYHNNWASHLLVGRSWHQLSAKVWACTIPLSSFKLHAWFGRKVRATICVYRMKFPSRVLGWSWWYNLIY